MDEKSIELLMKVNQKIQEIEDLVCDSEMEHRVLSVIMFGVIPEEALTEENEGEAIEMKSLFQFNIQSKDELKSVTEAIFQAYDREDPLDNLLNSLGLSLN